jgi:hypothetical protein
MAIDSLLRYGSHALVPYLDHGSSIASSNLPPLTLLNTSTWTYCGPLLRADADGLPQSFHTWASSTIDGDILPRLLPFLRFLCDFLRKSGAEHYWLTIRTTKPTTAYDTTRWHTDDVFFDSDGERDRVGSDQSRSRKNREKKKRYWKLATTLLGPGTLFLKDGARARKIQRQAKRAECDSRGEHICTQFRCLSCLDAVEAVRQTLTTAFKNDEIDSPKFGEAAFFRLGDEDGAVHSEPPCHTDRIFVNVVPGTKNELKALMKRWGLGYPRAWCFGVPVAFDDMSILSTIAAQSKMERFDSPTEGKVGDRTLEDESTKGRVVSFSTMSMNLGEEYAEWLREKGFHIKLFFGGIVRAQ